MLGLKLSEVAELANVQPNTVLRLEKDVSGPRGPNAATVSVIRRAYEARGVIFLDDGDPGVRFRI